MTTKAEKLARELIALSERYSERDFAAATDLLLSGRLFAGAVEAAQASRRVIKSGRRKSDSQARPMRRSPATAPRDKEVDASRAAQLDLDEFLRDVNGSEREDLASFARRFESREILESAASARVFAQQLGIPLSKSGPSRPAMLKAMLRRLRHVPAEARADLLKVADRMGSVESSLQRWSDLIVKDSTS